MASANPSRHEYAEVGRSRLFGAKRLLNVLGLYSRGSLALVDDHTDCLTIQPDVMKDVPALAFMLDEVRPEFALQARRKLFFELQAFRLRCRPLLQLLKTLFEDTDLFVFPCEHPLGSGTLKLDASFTRRLILGDCFPKIFPKPLKFMLVMALPLIEYTECVLIVLLA
jgi:hypothetical protein